jgi:hypothetical protein
VALHIPAKVRYHPKSRAAFLVVCRSAASRIQAMVHPHPRCRAAARPEQWDASACQCRFPEAKDREAGRPARLDAPDNREMAKYPVANKSDALDDLDLARCLEAVRPEQWDVQANPELQSRDRPGRRLRPA